MVELHSNFTIEGSKTVIDGMLPTEHAEHERVEITRGINDWAEVGFYLFTRIQSDGRWQWVGDHIRPRVRVPEQWHWPVGVGLSTEFGYQRPAFSPDTCTWEIRPIIDDKIGRWYLPFNPALDRSFHGPSVNQGGGVFAQREIQLRHRQKDRGRAGILRRLRIAEWFRCAGPATAAIVPCYRRGLRPPVGVQFRSRHRGPLIRPTISS